MKIKARLKDDIKRYLLQKQEEEENKVVITAAHNLSEQEIQEVQELFPEIKGKKLDVVVDESLIAGLVIRHGSKILDLSLKQKLMSLQHRVNEIA